MAVKGNPDGMSVDKLIDLLVIREIMGLKKVMYEVHIREHPRPVYVPSINRSHLDNSVRIAGRKRQWGAVEVNYHPGQRSINISCDTVSKTEDTAGVGIAIIAQLIIVELEKRTDSIRDFCATVRDRYQERIAFFYHFQLMDICREILLIFGSDISRMCRI